MAGRSSHARVLTGRHLLHKSILTCAFSLVRVVVGRESGRPGRAVDRIGPAFRGRSVCSVRDSPWGIEA
ncbi:hypothetical protein SGPA1_20237 [Streptomyces misionensis JCM 4497]